MHQPPKEILHAISPPPNRRVHDIDTPRQYLRLCECVDDSLLLGERVCVVRLHAIGAAHVGCFDRGRIEADGGAASLCSKGKKSVSTRQQLFSGFPTALGLDCDLTESRFA